MLLVSSNNLMATIHLLHSSANAARLPRCLRLPEAANP
jgi:hypothetical protein